MTTGEAWKEFFLHWPHDVERRGIVVAAFGEQIPFDGYATSEHLVMFERRVPDTAGARKVLLAYSEIQAVKITDVVKTRSFHAVGFEESRPKKS
jgi:hypothetical protein